MTFYYPITVKPTAADCDKHGDVNLVYISYSTQPASVKLFPVHRTSVWLQRIEVGHSDGSAGTTTIGWYPHENSLNYHTWLNNCKSNAIHYNQQSQEASEATKTKRKIKIHEHTESDVANTDSR